MPCMYIAMDLLCVASDAMHAGWFFKCTIEGLVQEGQLPAGAPPACYLLWGMESITIFVHFASKTQCM